MVGCFVVCLWLVVRCWWLLLVSVGLGFAWLAFCGFLFRFDIVGVALTFLFGLLALWVCGCSFVVYGCFLVCYVFGFSCLL